MSSSKGNASSKVTPSQGTTLRRSNSVWSVNTTHSTASQINAKAVQLPDLKKFEKAPEIAHLKIQHFASNANVNSVELNKEDFQGSKGKLRKCWLSCCGFKASCVRFFRKLINGSQLYEELDDLDPVTARTRNSLEYIHRLSIEPTDQKHIQITDVGSRTQLKKDNKGTPQVKKDPTQLLKRRAYRAIYVGDTHLHEVHQIYKQLTLMLTFSRYAEDKLNPQEQDLTHLRTVLGSYIWLATYMLDQIQYDNDILYTGYSTNDVTEIIRSLEKLVRESAQAWKELVATIEVVEKVHENMQTVFSSIVAKIGKDISTMDDFKKARHIRVHSNFQRRKEELERLKEFEGAHAHHNFASISLAPLRILYKDSKSKQPSWKGFDLLAQSKKFSMVKILLSDALKIFQIVQEQLDHVGQLLETKVAIKQIKKTRSLIISNPTAVLCFNDGIDHMQKYLGEMETLWNKVWTPPEIKEFLEVEKITSDNLDLLTLGTATVRQLLLESRHLIHICYELTRELDYSECRQMQAYEDVVSHVMHNYNLDNESSMSIVEIKNKMTDPTARPVYPRHLLKHSQFDIDERNLGKYDVENKFDRSIYQDIIKELPVFTNNFALSFTLQDSESVFSESSHQLLSTVVPL